MGKLNWPMLSRERPKDVFEHANLLKEDFQALHNHVKKLKAKKRHLAKLPTGYKSKISKGIFLGVTEAIEREYYPKFICDIDKDLFCKTLLQTIRGELITEVHDRIPLLEFDTLHSSYKELVKKLSYTALDVRNRDITPDTDLEHNQGDASPPPTSHILDQTAIPGPNIEDGEIDMEIDEEAYDILRTLQATEDQGTFLRYQLDFLHGYTEEPRVQDSTIGPSRNGRDEGEEILDVVQAEHRENANESEREEEIRDSAIVKYGACEAKALEGPSYLQDGDAGANAVRGLHSDESTRKSMKSYEPPVKEETPNIQGVAAIIHSGVAAAEISKLITFEIKHQATVNRLILATSQDILDHLYRSLQKIVTTRESVTDLVHLSEPRLADDGNVIFRADTDSQDLFRPAPIHAWEAGFEASISPTVPTFILVLPDMELNSMSIETRKGKANVIHELFNLNYFRLSSLHGASDIVDLTWNPLSKPKQFTSLWIEFSNRQVAKQALQEGLLWQGIIHKCQKIPIRLSNPRCSRCQTYGHVVRACSAPYRCGRCAEAHPTEDCTSPNRRCAICGGPHPAKSASCPTRKAEQKKFRFTTPKPTANNGKRKRVTVRSDVEMAGTMGQSNLPPSTLALAASLKNTDTDEERLRLTQCENCQSYGHVAGQCSARTRCGKCSHHHSTWECWSRFARCALCRDDHVASSAICPARPPEKARSQLLQEPGIQHMPLLRTSTPDLSPQEPEIKSEPQSPSPRAIARPKRTPKKRSMLAQVGELLQVVSKGNSPEMALIKDHLETLESAMIAEGGDIVAVTPRAGKRKAQEALMSGALQDRPDSPKRIKALARRFS